MQRACENIYKNARVSAGLTQEKAAELLDYSPRSLGAYETGETRPSDDTVDKMIQIYNCPYLGYQHLRETTVIGSKYLPEIQRTDLAMAVLRLQKESADLEKVKGKMVELACDGTIDDSEKSQWSGVMEEIKHVVGASMALMYAR